MNLVRSGWANLGLAALTCFCLFYAPQNCQNAAVQALRLCGGPLLVGIFPFLIISNLITSSGVAPILALPLKPLAKAVGCRRPAGAAVLLLGFVGGFAPAACTCTRLHRQGEISAEEASFLLAAAAGSSPSFVILAVGRGMLNSPVTGVKLYLCQIIAACVSTALLSRLRRSTFHEQKPILVQQDASPGLSGAIADGALSYIKLCGFVIYFRCLSAGLSAFLPKGGETVASILLEVSSGCQFAAQLPLFAPSACCTALSIQSISVLMQLRTLCPAPISLRPLLLIRPLHLTVSLGLLRLSFLFDQSLNVYNSLAPRVIAMPRTPLPCILLLFCLCVLVSGRLCSALQQSKK
ncbi:MAG: hypothetical protein IJ347_02810 [Faecalibacterium sp.]|nr:hypothetical protein [Faecalibacterium sp.]